MPQNNESNPPQRKVEALRRIQLMLDQIGRVPAHDAGVTEDEFAELANGGLIEVSADADEGLILNRYHIDKILPKGVLILANASLAEPSPLRVSVVAQPKTVCRRIYEVTRSGLWDLIKIAFGMVLGAILAKYFGK